MKLSRIKKISAVFLLISFSTFFISKSFAHSETTSANTKSIDLANLIECQKYDKKLTKITNENKKLDDLLKFTWTQWMQGSPEYATYVGHPGMDHLWGDRSLSAIEASKKLTLCHLNLISKVNEKKLSELGKINYLLLKKKMELQKEANTFFNEYLAIDQMGGIHMDLIDLIQSSPKSTLNDIHNRIQRIESYPKVIDDTIILLEEGLKKKITPVQFLIKKIPDQIQSLIFENPKESALYTTMAELPTDFTTEQKTETLAKTEKLIVDKINPSLKKLKKYLEEKYIPNCRTEIAHTTMPNGKQWYTHLIKYHTTTDLTAEAIHQIGLNEVFRINSEMTKIRDELKFKGTKEEFHKFIQTDKQFFFENPKDLISRYQNIAKQIDPELPRLFKLLPRLTYGVREMAAFKAKSAPTAYYMPGSLSSGRPGYFEANTYSLKSRPTWEMEVLTVHEAVPGHHLQIAIAQELGELPEFRKNDGYTAFVEGWGLYSESLGDDLGMYKDLYSRYGKLVFEMWRAVRLVVDTGMHQFGWSKDKALNYFMDNIPKDRLQSEVEIDRYISMPGQALAYKIGQLKLLELKALAKKTLGDKFDIREYHYQVLRHGAVPLNVLENEIKLWMASILQKKTKIN